MNWSAGITIQFYDPVRFSHVLTILREAGWRTADGQIHYELDIVRGDTPPEGPKSAPAAEWDRVMALLDAHLEQGGDVNASFSWQGRDGDGAIYASCMMEEPTRLHFFPDQVSIALEPELPFIDFSWLIRRTVIPLAKSGLHLAQIDCQQGR